MPAGSHDDSFSVVLNQSRTRPLYTTRCGDPGSHDAIFLAVTVGNVTRVRSLPERSAS